ncbi:MAG: hypothetical protein ABI673_04335 [Novosphingobium sp.]
MNISVVDATAQQVAGVRQIKLSLFYQVPTMQGMVGLPDLSLTRPIYVATT